MSSGIARDGDMAVGTCTAHKNPIQVTGTVIGGSTKVFCDDRKVARKGDKVVASCGHEGTISTGSSVVECEGKPVARKGDSFTGNFSGTIVTGSSKTESI